MKTLVALDGSPDAFGALACACKLALKTRAYVTAFYVNKSEAYSSEDTGWVSLREKIQKELEARGHEVIRRAAAIGRDHGVQVEGIMAYGVPAEEIAKYCAARGIVNLVAMGHSSKKRGTQGFVASTTRMVLATVDRTSVLVTSTAAEISRIVVAVDGGAASRKAVAAAGGLARSLEAEVRLLSVVPDTEAMLHEYRQIAEVPNVERYLRRSEAELSRRAALAVEEAAQELARLGVRVSTSVERGSPATAIVAAAGKAHLTVVGLQEVREEQRRIGRILRKLLETEELSVLCVP